MTHLNLTRFASILFGISNLLLAQWSTTPNNHVMISPEGESPKICSGGDGGAYIIWNNYSRDHSRVYLQHVDKYGNKTLTTPIIVCDTNDIQLQFDMIEDGYNGVLILVSAGKWIDKQTNYWQTKLFVQRVDKNLNKLWGESGVRVSMKENDQNCYAAPKIVCDKKIIPTYFLATGEKRILTRSSIFICSGFDMMGRECGAIRELQWRQML